MLTPLGAYLRHFAAFSSHFVDFNVLCGDLFAERVVTCLLMFACYDFFESCWDLFTDIVMVQKCYFISCCDLSESYGLVVIKDGSASAPHSVSSCLASSAIIET